MRPLILLLLPLLSWGQPAGEGRLAKRTIAVNGVERTYWVASPVERSPAPPIVLVFHARSGTGEQAARNGRMHTSVAGRRSLVAYLDGTNQTWSLQGTDDIAFSKAVIDAVASSDRSLDRSRVFAVGAGVGGAFVQRLACEVSDRFAAVAVIATGMPAGLRASCKPAEATPILLLQAGGVEDDSFAWWSKKNGCSAAPVQETRSGFIPYTLKVARSCKDGAEVQQCSRSMRRENPWVEDGVRLASEFLLRFRRLPRL